SKPGLGRPENLARMPVQNREIPAGGKDVVLSPRQQPRHRPHLPFGCRCEEWVRGSNQVVADNIEMPPARWRGIVADAREDEFGHRLARGGIKSEARVLVRDVYAIWHRDVVRPACVGPR